jgi:hypothetical protein
VIGRVWDEQTGFARHGSSLHARGRDSDILLPTAKHHNVIREPLSKFMTELDWTELWIEMKWKSP